MVISIPTSFNQNFYWILISSAILHVFILSFINFSQAEKQTVEKIFEVQLQKITIPKPKVIIPKPKPKVTIQKQKRLLPKKPQYLKKTKIVLPQKPLIQKIQKIYKIQKTQHKLKSDLVFNEKKINKSFKLLDKPLPTVKPVAKPSLKTPLTNTIDKVEITSEIDGFLDTDVKLPDSKNQHREIQLKAQNTKRKVVVKGIKADQIKPGEKSGDITAGEITQTVNNYKISEKIDKVIPPNPINNNTSIFNDLKIEGEVSHRKLIYQPQAPNLDIDKDLTISLKFSVLPSGVVDQIIPFKKADPDLEKLAIGLLLQYRFEPLFGEKTIQYGIIHFSIKRSN
ncbi:MAG: hypothetical protein HOC24_08330 [Deltaproteobacteria bacterium]|nr:hypothetical protein [Deltaproteobacteria bacterium]